MTVPQGWRIVRLGDCCRGAPEYGANAPAVEHDQSLPRYIRITDIDESGRLIRHPTVSVRLEGNEKHILEDGDFLFARSGATVGKTYLHDARDGWAVYAGYLIRFRVDPTVLLPQYLRLYTQTHDYRHWVESTLRAGAQPNINAKEYASLELPLPPLAAQRKIVQILCTWDQAIALTGRLIEAKRRRKKGLMQQLLTGRRRFREFEGQEWGEVRLGEVFRERKERGFEHLPLLSITDDQGIIRRDELDRRDTSNLDKSRYLRICEEDVGYNTMRMWQGRCAVSQLEGIVSPAYTVCVPNRDVDVHFVGYLFRLPSIVHLFRRYSQGLVSDVWNLKFPVFARIRVCIPTLAEQQAIAALLRACDGEIDLLNRKLALLREQKKGLMQQLLTGKVRV
jgi:type I restriction enzyme S subunit